MTTEFLSSIVRDTIPAAFGWLPGRMDSQEARSLVLAIGIQESGFVHRRETAGEIPKRGFWQLEARHLSGVLLDGVTSPILVPICRAVRVVPEAASVRTAIEYHDTLAAICARCLLWTASKQLPGPMNGMDGWDLYLGLWRPSRPTPETWRSAYQQAWDLIGGVRT